MKLQVNQIDENLKKYIKKKEETGILGAVHSKYEKVVNILTADEEHMLSIAIDLVSQSPYMMQTDDRYAFFEFVQSVNAGDKVSITSEFQIRTNFHVMNFENADVWQVSLKESSFDPDELEKKLSVCQQFLQKYKDAKGIISLVGRQETADWNDERKDQSLHERKFEELLHQFERDFSPELLKEFVGLGIGLTPSGDDFLTGLWAAWQYYHFEPFNTIIEEKEEWLHYIKQRTTIVSYHMLKYCLEGEVSDTLYRLLADPPEKTDEHLTRLASFGSTSGTDMIAGVICALRKIMNSDSL